MSYRTIKVESEEYRYVVGKTHIKIQKDGKAFGIWEKSAVGTFVKSKDDYIITPRTIQCLILGLTPSLADYCEEHDCMCTGEAVDPYMSEIHGEDISVQNCPKCLSQSAMDI